MSRIQVFFLILFLSAPASAQWRQIAKFMSTDDLGNPVVENTGLLYFLDHPGSPMTGFTGGDVELWKTTNGGMTWTISWNQVTAIPNGYTSFLSMSFVDSMNGWFSCGTSNPYPVCWRTTDAGNSWTPQFAENLAYLDGVGS